MRNIINADIENYVFIADCKRERGTKLERESFQELLKDVQALRCQVYDNRFTFYIHNRNSYADLFDLHSIVNSNTEDYDKLFNRKVFLVGFPPRLYSWLRNLSFDMLQLQIQNWIAASVYFNPEDATILEEQIYEPTYQSAMKILHRYSSVSNDHDNHNTYQKQIDQYHLISTQLTGAKPPEFLSQLGRNQPNQEWGLNRYLNFEIAVAYLRNDDWDHIVVNRSEDKMRRSESNSLLFEKWNMVYKRYPVTKDNIINSSKNSRKRHFVYVLREGDSRRYKIGWTLDPVVENRIKGLQTGNSFKIKPMGIFEVTSKSIENAIQNFFKDNKINEGGREWFILQDRELRLLLDKEWRLQQNFI